MSAVARTVLVGAVLTVIFAVTACSYRPRLPSAANIPFVHRIDIQQGNVIEQEMLAQLQPGMEKSKVLFIMGSPLIQDTFHADRWDYIYSFQEGGGTREQRRVSLFFEDERLARVEGDVKPALGRLEVRRERSSVVEVPGEYRPSLVSRLKDKVGLGDEPIPAPDDGVDDQAGAESADAAGTESAGEEAAAPELAEQTVVIPEDAPRKKKKGFFARLFGGSEESQRERAKSGARDDGYRDPTDNDDSRF